jgi:hypothetical protein
MPSVYKMMFPVFILFFYKDLWYKSAIFSFQFFGHRWVIGRAWIDIDGHPAGHWAHSNKYR